ncbi:MAG: NIPSNAP family protein [Rhizomicrobium sp.]
MSVFVHVTLEVKAAGVARFVEAMGEIVPLLEGWGWKLSGAFMQRTGKLNTIIDLWEIKDHNQFDSVLQKFAAHPRFPALKAVLDETVSSETIVFANKLTYRR